MYGTEIFTNLLPRQEFVPLALVLMFPLRVRPVVNVAPENEMSALFDLIVLPVTEATLIVPVKLTVAPAPKSFVIILPLYTRDTTSLIRVAPVPVAVTPI